MISVIARPRSSSTCWCADHACAAAMSTTTYLRVTLADECVACDEVGNNPLGPRVGPFTVIERHHQLPQMRLAALREIFQYTPLRFSDLGRGRKGLHRGGMQTTQPEVNGISCGHEHNQRENATRAIRRRRMTRMERRRCAERRSTKTNKRCSQTVHLPYIVFRHNRTTYAFLSYCRRFRNRTSRALKYVGYCHPCHYF